MSPYFADPHIGTNNEGYEYVRYVQFERGERTDDLILCTAFREQTEQRNRRIKQSDKDHAIDTQPARRQS